MIYEQEQQTKQNTKQTKILIIDDDRAIRRFLNLALSAYGYDVHEAPTGQEGIMKIVSCLPDLILLDIDLPDMNGIEIIQAVREWTQTPILMLSINDHDTNKVEALDSGADDYIVKPFSMGELMARMRVALRRTRSMSEDPAFSCGDLRVNLAARIVEVRGQQIVLTPIEYDLLRALVNHAGKIITHQQLWKQTRDEDYKGNSHLIRVHMSNLRNKLERDPTSPQYILTEAGVGYRLRTDM